MTKYFLTPALAVATALSLSAQVGIGTKNPNGALEISSDAVNKEGKTVKAALVLPKVENVADVKSPQGNEKPALGSLIFDQAQQCLKYFALKEIENPDSGEWSTCMSRKHKTGDLEQEIPADPIYHETCGKNLVYGQIQSPRTKRIWLDRNLGATRMAEVNTDPRAIGSLYQWGRPSDGHECIEWEDSLFEEGKGSAVTRERAESITPGHDKTIFPEDANPSSWFLGLRMSDGLWKKNEQTGVVPNNPCPKGFRPPTIQEISDEHDEKDLNLRPKNLRFAGSLIRNLPGRKKEYFVTQGYRGIIWTSDMLSDRQAHITSQTQTMNAAFIIDLHSVRCIKDEGGLPQVN